MKLIFKIINIFEKNFSKSLFLILIDSLLVFLCIGYSEFIFESSLILGNNNIFNFDYNNLNFLWILISLISFKFNNIYKQRIRFINHKIFYYFGLSNLATAVIFFIFIKTYPDLYINNQDIFQKSEFKYFSVILITQTLLLSLSRYFLCSLIIFKNTKFNHTKKSSNVVIYGAGKIGSYLAELFKRDNENKICFFIDDDINLNNREIYGYKIYHPKNKNLRLNTINKLLIAAPYIKESRIKKIIKNKKDLEILYIPNLDQLNIKYKFNKSLKQLSIESLLMRDAVKPDYYLMDKVIKNKNICVTGAGGSIGNELCRKILELKPNCLLMLDNSEPKIYELNNQYPSHLYKSKIKFQLGCISDKNMLIESFNKYKIDTVFHAAAYKHVPIVEENPLQGIENNALNTKILCESIVSSNVSKMILISTDKAVRPTSVMGASKRLAELVVQGFAKKYKHVNFSLVRFGNVLGSSGSVVPYFQKQIESGGPITLTDKKIIRYFMTVSEAAELVIQSAELSKSGDVNLLDMGKPIKIKDLALHMIKLSGLSLRNEFNPKGDIEIKVTGLRPGEKLYEELLIDSSAEKTRHPLIYRAKEKSLSFEDIYKITNKIKDELSKSNTKSVLSLLKEAVPEWNNKIS